MLDVLIMFMAKVKSVTANVDAEKSANAMCEVLRTKEL